MRRIAEVNPKINALVVNAADAARAEADGALAQGEWLGPLYAVPVSIKGSFDTAGLVTTAGTTDGRS